MFASIRLKLAVLNAVVILFVLLALSSLLYVHMRFRLYHDADEFISAAESRIASLHDLSAAMAAGGPDPAQDETTTYLFWDARGELIGQMPNRSFPDALAARFKRAEGENALRTLMANGHAYRAYNYPNLALEPRTIAEIGIVRNLDDARGTLRALRMDIYAAAAAGVAVSLPLGLFLAGRALVPIRRSREKETRFVADASHELRTPIAVVQAQTELLLRVPGHTIEREAGQINVILKESRRMSRLVNDLLTLARSDSDRLLLRPEDFELDVLARELASRFRLLAATKRVAIRCEADAPVPIRGDEERVRQLLAILLDNALKYTPPDGRIALTVRRQASFAVIGVADTGCGIAKEDLPRVFDRFYRGDKARSRAEGGTGLGLSIAEWIAKAHGGAITIASEPGEGTVVEVRLRAHARHGSFV
ncbi:His Kinase A (phospho-acceptor) domain-containing protein [Paenibacillus sp. UNC496MF]|uniref:sensor histidine kinase n=1 Tax=Paenibacillus sp. UNC496MF TaxID=1502753 RepID=UPI0008EC9BE2|nr:ATP-binding protein [Paenibacillus sp. UNC496MF]SFI38155.1 His Kinase A (phospho-acceptor) domain-containing protein [Paenibacillus sp. UNC496MF]